MSGPGKVGIKLVRLLFALRALIDSRNDAVASCPWPRRTSAEMRRRDAVP